ncbi:class I SAM-dependent methyltransferase [Paenibacillus methanolicus]|uniref:Methyltransferase family protein n=1 Tax=Paenibacillus methanolicus TaxID=582686 RepID=A0A5S5C5K5_9BACL|nr:class I SAM-dependent methyltransferase [Paenibacillus methanolicus]TYP73752.1 methyltransferase family protein [Paenibacillus methanolicus]
MDSKTRFSNRVQDYVKFRPSYPPALIDAWFRLAGVKAGDRVADVGAGTGIFTRLLLDRDLEVLAVEPNDDMRVAAEQAVSPLQLGRFRSVAASAEETTLADAEVDAVVSAQAFHWFDPSAARAEFGRILKPGGTVALVWNTRDASGNRFAVEYEALLHAFSPDYENVGHRRLTPGDFEAFFANGAYERVEYVNEQWISLPELIGRASSSSYTPTSGTEAHVLFTQALTTLFNSHEQQGRVPFHYLAELYIGRV